MNEQQKNIINQVISIIFLILTLFLIELSYNNDIGNYKYYGYLGYFLIGYFFNNKILFIK